MPSDSIIRWVLRIGTAFNMFAPLLPLLPDSGGAFALVFFAWLGYGR